LADKEKLTSSTATINKVEMIWNQFGRANWGPVQPGRTHHFVVFRPVSWRWKEIIKLYKFDIEQKTSVKR
jgi:hypothetical protein